MPQMAPISWLTLFLMFSLALIMFCSLNYFTFLPASPKSSIKSEPSKNLYNWKW